MRKIRITAFVDRGQISLKSVQMIIFIISYISNNRNGEN